MYRCNYCKRYLKKKLGKESGHKENLSYLRNLHKIRKNYAKNVLPDIKQKMKDREDKSYVIHNFCDVCKIIDNVN